MKRLLALILLCACTQLVWASSTSLNLLSRSSFLADDLPSAQNPFPAYKEKMLLHVGISEPDYPPFDITNHANEFEGISADYLGLIGQLLNAHIVITRYRNRVEVIEALKRGEVDLLTSANEFEASDPELQLTRPYILDQPTLVERVQNAEAVEPPFGGKTIAMVNHYLPLSTVQSAYPQATLELYPSIVAAVSAVAFDKADLYLGDSISTSYLINKSYLNNVQLLDYPGIKVSHFAFALERNNTALLDAVNAALKAIPAHEQMSIARRWNASDASVIGTPKLHFSAEEKRWMAEHPRLSVVANEEFLPFSFFSDGQRLRGLSADVLAKISLRTGLKFIAHKDTSVHDMMQAVQSGDADIVAALAPSSEREQHVSFSRPYFSSPVVLVTRSERGSPNDLNAMAGKKLVIISGNAKQEGIKQRFPKIEIIHADNLLQAFLMLANGEADASLSFLSAAHYQIAKNFQGALKIASTIGGNDAQLAFAFSRNAPLLQSILNKSLLSISPEEMDEITSRWRSPMVFHSYWDKHRAAILQGFAIFAMLLLLASLWIVLLRRQVLKRKIAESALSDRLKFERVLIDGTPHPIYVRDHEGRLLACNSAYRKAFGILNESGVLGKTVIQSPFSGDEQAHEYHRDYLHAMANNAPLLKDRLMILPNGKVQTIQHWILPYQGEDGGVSGVIGGWVDVSDRQQLLEQLQAAKHQADKANRAKTSFLSTMSHEIRTPMNAIIGMLEMAAKKAEQGVLDLHAIDVASDASKGLLALIGDILDISRIEAGHKDLMLNSDNPHPLLMGVAKVFDGLARQKAIQLIVDIEPGVDQCVMIDSLRFKQVVANLLSNAIKFTAIGQVRISAHVRPSQDSRVIRLQVSIEDSGVGITAADQQRLFTPFTQVGQQDLATGSGLGLTISRSLMEIMGGSLELSSEEAKGTRVVLQLDLPKVSVPPSAGLPAPHIEPPPLPTTCTLSVLIVDDYAVNRTVLTQQLTYLGHEVQAADSGARAWALWNEQPFDVVVTDCNMPGMTGYELARAIRAAEQQQGHPGCLLLGFTASAVPEEKQRCIDAGMDDCLFKPVSLQQLTDCLRPLQTAYFAEADEAELSTESIETHLSAFTFGNPVVMQNLKDELTSNTRVDMETLATLVRECDRLGLAEFAHRVKGAARLIQYERLMVSCDNLGAACNSDSTPQKLNELAKNLERCLKELVDCLHS